MMRIHNVDSLTEKEVSHLREYVSKSSDEATTTNHRKNQYVFETTTGGRSFIVKQYIHRNAKHRWASFFGQGNADRYCSISLFLRAQGLPIPKPVLILKTGRGLLPERTLYAMERVDGQMLSVLLPDLEADPARARVLARKAADLIHNLRQAGVVHRDLNTKNFLVSPQNNISLIDFDYASRHRIQGRRFARRHDRDVHCFLSTCHGAPRFAAAVTSHL